MITRFFSYTTFAFLSSVLLITPALAKVQNPVILPSKSAFYPDDAVRKGDVLLTFRARAEHSHEAMLKPGEAFTLSTMLTYNTAEMCGFVGFLEFDHVTSYANHKHNAGLDTTPAQEGIYPLIADPEGTAMTQAYIQFTGWNKTYVKIGRQAFNFDDERFVGTSSFRQTPQTYDAFSIHSSPLPNINWFYAYVGQVNSVWQGNNRAITGKRKHSSHLINATWIIQPCLSLTGYAYLLNDRATPIYSSDTYGARLAGSTQVERDFIFKYNLELATQHSRHNNPAEYSAQYYLLDFEAIYQGFGANAGYAILEGDDSAVGESFKTGLASSHKFQGWTDVFLNSTSQHPGGTPDQGLRDLYAGLYFFFPYHIKLEGFYHYFDNYSGDGSLGHEWDFGLYKRFYDQVHIGLQYATFKAKVDSGYPSDHRIWLSVAFKVGR